MLSKVGRVLLLLVVFPVGSTTTTTTMILTTITTVISNISTKHSMNERERKSGTGGSERDGERQRQWEKSIDRRRHMGSREGIQKSRSLTCKGNEMAFIDK